MKKAVLLCTMLVALCCTAYAAKKEVLNVGSMDLQTISAEKAEAAQLLDLIAAAKAAGEMPNPAWSARLDELMPPSGSRNSLDQGGVDWANAVVIPAVPYNTTGTMDAADDCVGRPYQDVFYRYTVATAGSHTIDMCNSAGDTYIKVWRNPTGTCLGGITSVSDDVCGDDPSITLVLAAGDVVYFECGYYYTTGGTTYNFNVSGPTPPPAGDVCATALPLTVPGTVSGSTTTFNNDYDFACDYTGSTAKDVVYRYTPTQNELVTFNLCGGTTNYDTKLYIYAGTCANPPIACNDDLCANGTIYPSPYISKLECVQLTAGVTYYVVVDGYGSSSGAYTLEATICNPCVVECPTGGIPEGEPVCGPDYVDAYNGGCNSTPNIFQSIYCGQTICGTSGTFLAGANNSRDTDWFELVLTEEDSITWSVTAEFPVLIFILTPVCPPAAIAQATAATCETATVTACLQPGTYYLWVGPSAFTGVACGADYVATLTCQPCAQPFVCRCDELPNTHCDFTAVPIVDNTTVEMSIVVPIEYHITDLNVCLDIVHTWDSDLTISVVSPLGTVVELSSNNGGSGDNYTCTTFDDEASTLITAGTPPFSGSFIPEGSLASFDGENAIGTWIIRVYDGAGGDIGVLNWACLTFEYDYILAVELLGDLTATARDRAVTLNWSTASEVNNERFEILRAGRVVGTKAGAGTSSDRHDYSWTEERLDNGVTYTYTLVSVDVNGTRNELATISATPSFNAATVTEYALHQNFPNPFNPVTSIAFDLVENGFVSLKVYNLMGQEVASLVGTEMNAGRHIVNFDASRLSSGVYLYTIEAGSFSASKKMLLMK